MDPLTVIGAVASIAQLAQGALSLSKILYSLGAAVASANDDIQVLADDLKTFSQSLTLLSRLLEDNKLWYSDDIYLLTAKIIKDCAELYVKIDKILVKLGGNGKSTWKLRVKFVYKEGQIRKLMKRLRDMKGTLATILMSLQVDLQLSLLNISSSSKIQREPQKPLQPETIQTLVDAQKVAQQTRFLSKYNVHSEHIIRGSEIGCDVFKSQNEVASEMPLANDPATCMELAQSSHPDNDLSLLTKFRNEPDSTVTKGIETGPANAIPTLTKRFFQPINMMVHQQIPQNTAKIETLACERTTAKSLRSISSVESFQSAVSVQRSFQEPEAQNEVEQQVEAVRSVLHAFKTALEVLTKLIEKRRLVKIQELYPTAKHLEKSLTEGEKEFKGTHDCHCLRHGAQYIQAFTDCYNTALQDISSALMKDVVMPLHIYTADHVTIRKADLQTLRACSERYQVQAILIIADVASPLVITHPEVNFHPYGSPSEIAAEPPIQYVIPRPPRQSTTESETRLPLIGYNFKRFANHRSDSNSAVKETVIQPNKKDLDLLRGDQPISVQISEYSSRSFSQQQRPLSLSSLMRQERPPASNISTPHFGSSIGHMENLVDQQQQGIMTQEAGQMAVPASGAQCNALPQHANPTVAYSHPSSDSDSLVELDAQIQDLQHKPCTSSCCSAGAHFEATRGQSTPYFSMPVQLTPIELCRRTSPERKLRTAKRARLSRPKVKSGCSSCKTRRVKCNETKPRCLRCQRFGRVCDYPEPPSAIERGKAFIPLVSAGITPLEYRFNTPEYIAPGAYFSPLNSPAFRGQNEQSHPASAISPADVNLDSVPAGSTQENPPLAAALPPSIGHGPSSLFGGIMIGQAAGISGHSTQLETTSSLYFGPHLPNHLPMDMARVNEAHDNAPSKNTPDERPLRSTAEERAEPFLQGPTSTHRPSQAFTTNTSVPSTTAGRTQSSPVSAVSQSSFTSESIPSHVTYQYLFLSQPFAPPLRSSYPSILHARYSGRPVSATKSINDASAYPLPPYPASPALSHISRSPRPVKAESQSPYMVSQYSSQPMVIPQSRDPVPPPLPPLRHLVGFTDGGTKEPDIAWQCGNSQKENGWEGSISSVVPESRGGSSMGSSPVISVMLPPSSSPLATGFNSSAKYAAAPQFVQPSYLRAMPGNGSIHPGPSATSSAMGIPHSIHGQIVPIPEWTPHGLGMNSSIVGFDSFAESNNEYSFDASGMEDFDPDFNAAKSNGFVGEYNTITASSSLQHLPSITEFYNFGQSNNYPFLAHSLMDSNPLGVPLSDSQKDYTGILTEVSDRDKRKLATVEDSFPKMEGQPSRKKKRTSGGLTMSGPTSSTTPELASKSRQMSFPPQCLSEGVEEISVEIISLNRLRSDDPFKELWWQAYCFLNSSEPVIFGSLSSGAKKQYGEFLSNILDHHLSTRVTNLVEGISADRYRGRPYLMPLAAYRANIVKVVMTISSQLGLEQPVMGWAFVGVLLSIYERLFETWDRSLPITNVEAITKSFQQLQDLAGLLARYAVMENLYHQGTSFALTPKYQNDLQDLCVTVLQYFGNAIVVARGAGKEESTLVVGSRKRCDGLIDEVKEKDKACQGFRIVVEADEESSIGSEDSEIEDVSDGNWEVLGTERSSKSELVT